MQLHVHSARRVCTLESSSFVLHPEVSLRWTIQNIDTTCKLCFSFTWERTHLPPKPISKAAKLSSSLDPEAVVISAYMNKSCYDRKSLSTCGFRPSWASIAFLNLLFVVNSLDPWDLSGRSSFFIESVMVWTQVPMFIWQIVRWINSLCSSGFHGSHCGLDSELGSFGRLSFGGK